MIEVKCEVCGKVVRRSPSKVHNHVFCSHECWKTMASAMWTKDQRDAVRRREKKNKGDCKAGTYPKFHGRHEHRVVAERMWAGRFALERWFITSMGIPETIAQKI